MTDYTKARQNSIDEAIERIESFKHKSVLQMRLGETVSDAQYEFTCKLIDAQIKPLNAKASHAPINH